MGIETFPPSSGPYGSYRTNGYYTAQGTSGTFSFPDGLLRAHAVTIWSSVTVTHLALEVTSAAASSTVRMGIYRDEDGGPGELLLDGGTVDSSTTGAKVLDVTDTVLATGRWWLAAAPIGAAVGMTSFTNYGLDSASSTNPTTAVGNTLAGYLSTNTVTGALPDPFGINDGTIYVPRIYFRAA